MELIITRGLPASGKTTWARQWVEDAEARARTNRDDLRHNLFGKYWGLTYPQEEQVTAAQRSAVSALLAANVSVVVDDTNLRAAHAREWQKLAGRLGASFHVVDFPVSVDECIDRDRVRGLRGERFVGSEVIQQMAARYGLRKRWLPSLPEPEASDSGYRYEPDLGLPAAWLVDIDGTLAHMTTRGPFDWKRVGEDTVNEIVRELVKAIALDGSRRVVLLSGRDSVCLDETLDWIARHGVPFDELLMRPEGDSRKDAVVKLEIFREQIAPRYHVRAVVDDRDQVVEMWRSIGLVCFQAAPGNF